MLFRSPRFSSAHVSPLYVAEALAKPGLVRHWLSLLGNVQVAWEHESAIQAPVAALLQMALGPSLELPTMVGAVWGLVAIVLAWRLGRAAESPAFGVVFATFVAVSPLQTTWARLGGLYIGASAGVLAVLYAGSVVGQRRGTVAAVTLGLAAWSCVYLYYPARVGLGLVFVAVWSGWWRSGRSVTRLAALGGATALGGAACLAVHYAIAPGQSLWPSYGTYLGSPGQMSMTTWLASVAEVVRRQLPLTLGSYFWSGRAITIVRAQVGPRRSEERRVGKECRL